MDVNTELQFLLQRPTKPTHVYLEYAQFENVTSAYDSLYTNFFMLERALHTRECLQSVHPHVMKVLAFLDDLKARNYIIEKLNLRPKLGDDGIMTIQLYWSRLEAFELYICYLTTDTIDSKCGICLLECLLLSLKLQDYLFLSSIIDILVDKVVDEDIDLHHCLARFNIASGNKWGFDNNYASPFLSGVLLNVFAYHASSNAQLQIQRYARSFSPSLVYYLQNK
jgi:hypothetical protein